MTTQNPANRPRALIAMSGGVDSSVAACLMQQAGYDCTGITMRLTQRNAGTVRLPDLLLGERYRGCRRGGFCAGYAISGTGFYR